MLTTVLIIIVCIAAGTLVHRCQDENAKLKELLAEAELGKAILKAIAAKSDVRCRARGCRPPAFPVRGERAADVFGAGDGSHFGALSQHTI